MATWVKFDRRSEGWDDAMNRLAHRKHPAAHEWFNLDTGAAVLAIADGDWREDRGPRTWVRVFHRSPGGNVVELTAAMFPDGDTNYDNLADEKDRYERPMRRVEKKLEAALGIDGA